MYIFDFKYHTRGDNFRAKRKYKYLKINILQLFHKDSNLLIYNIAPAVQFQRFKGFTHQRCLFHCSKTAVSKVQGFQASKMLVSLQQSCSFKGSRVSRIKDTCFISAKLQFQRFKGFMHQRCLFHCSKAAVSKVQEFHASKMLV